MLVNRVDLGVQRGRFLPVTKSGEMARVAQSQLPALVRLIAGDVGEDAGLFFRVSRKLFASPKSARSRPGRCA